MRSEGAIGLERATGIRGMGRYRMLVDLDDIGRINRIRKSYWD